MHILITSGAGCIKSHVVKLLLKDTSHYLTIIDNLSTGGWNINSLKHVLSFGGSIDDFSLICRTVLACEQRQELSFAAE